MLKTEMRNEKSTHIDKMSTIEMLQLIQEENLHAVEAVGAALPEIALAVDAAAAAIKNGGRLVYLGCGTSGRLGVLDAAECPPTYGVSPDTVVGIIAGGDRCLRAAAENQEDMGACGVEDLKTIGLNGKECVVGLSVAGGAAYVLEALKYAKSLGCVTVGITSNPGTPLSLVPDIAICTDTGPEVVTGSTRMKAGTAQKLVLNMISTCAMIHQGHVYENLMVNLKPSNIKLRGRTIRITASITGLPEAQAEALLEENGWVIRQAVQAYLNGKTQESC